MINQLTIVVCSDAIRLALLYKYGGFYSDLDVVILRGISHLKNVIASDQGIASLCFRMSHEKWREAKQQLSWWLNPGLLGGFFVSLFISCLTS